MDEADENRGVSKGCRETLLSECRAEDPGDLKANEAGAWACWFNWSGRGVNVVFSKSSTLGACGAPGVFGVGGADSVLLVIPDPIRRIAAVTIADVVV